MAGAATAEKPKGKAAEAKPEPNEKDQAADQLAARVRAVEPGQSVSGKDVLGWTDAQRKSVAALLDKPPKTPWDVHEKFAPAVEVLGKTKAERLAGAAIAKKLEAYERQRGELDKAFADRNGLAVEVAEAKKKASEANKEYADLKEELEAADIRIINLAQNKKNGQLTLPVEIPPKPKANGKAETNGKHEGNGQAAATGGDPAETTKTSDLPLSNRVKGLLDKAGLTTVRKLIRFMTDDQDYWWKEIKGLGETGFDEIQMAMTEFWKKHPDAK